jgi:hypothetical protein
MEQPQKARRTEERAGKGDEAENDEGHGLVSRERCDALIFETRPRHIRGYVSWRSPWLVRISTQ